MTPGPIQPGGFEQSRSGTQTTGLPGGGIMVRGAIPSPSGAYPSPGLPPWIQSFQQEAAQKAQEAEELQQRQLQSQLQRLPYDVAQKAYVAGLKLQGQRGYKADLDAGKPAHEALAKWAPMMFADHPQAFAGALRTSFTPQKPPPRFVPADPATGAPSHFEGGGVQFPPTVKPAQPEKMDQLTSFDLKRKATAVDAANRALSAATASGNDEAIGASRAALKAATEDYSKFRQGLVKAPSGAPTTQTVNAPPGAPTATRPATPSAKKTRPAIGTVEGGFRYKGGDPSKKDSWEKYPG